MDLEKLKYPIGKYQPPETLDAETMKSWIREIRELPLKVKTRIAGLSDEELSLRYRPEGWNIKQLVHHLSDSHINALVRVKWVLTEDAPTIKPYYEARWAELPDSVQLHPAISLNLLEAVHYKLVYLISEMTTEDWERKFYHPEYEGALEIGKYMGLYAWHGNHHLAHINQALEMKFS
ncbi:MAG: YfiT family bacillithiol transferase [Bacteroidota bacterium]